MTPGNVGSAGATHPGHVSLCSWGRGPSEVARALARLAGHRRCGDTGAAGDAGLGARPAPRERSRTGEEGRHGSPAQFAEMLL